MALARNTLCAPCCNQNCNYTTSVFDANTGTFLYDIDSQYPMPSTSIGSFDYSTNSSRLLPGKHNNIRICANGSSYQFTIHPNCVSGTWSISSPVPIANIPWNVTGNQLKALSPVGLFHITGGGTKTIQQGFTLQFNTISAECTYTIGPGTVTNTWKLTIGLPYSVSVDNIPYSVTASGLCALIPTATVIVDQPLTNGLVIQVSVNSTVLQFPIQINQPLTMPVSNNVDIVGPGVSGLIFLVNETGLVDHSTVREYDKKGNEILKNNHSMIMPDSRDPMLIRSDDTNVTLFYPGGTSQSNVEISGVGSSYLSSFFMTPPTDPAGFMTQWNMFGNNQGTTVDPNGTFNLTINFKEGAPVIITLGTYWGRWTGGITSANGVILAANNLSASIVFTDYSLDQTGGYSFIFPLVVKLTYTGSGQIMSVVGPGIKYGTYGGEHGWNNANVDFPGRFQTNLGRYFQLVIQETVTSPIHTSNTYDTTVIYNPATVYAEVTNKLKIDTLATKSHPIYYKHVSDPRIISGFIWNLDPTGAIAISYTGQFGESNSNQYQCLTLDPSFAWFNMWYMQWSNAPIGPFVPNHPFGGPNSNLIDEPTHHLPLMGIAIRRTVWPSNMSNPRSQPTITKTDQMTIWKNNVNTGVFDGQLSDIATWFNANFTDPIIRIRGDQYSPQYLYQCSDRTNILLVTNGYSHDYKNGVYRMYDLQGVEVVLPMYLQGGQAYFATTDSSHLYLASSGGGHVLSLDGDLTSKGYFLHKIDKATGLVISVCVLNPSFISFTGGGAMGTVSTPGYGVGLIQGELVQSSGANNFYDMKLTNGELYIAGGNGFYSFDTSLTPGIYVPQTNAKPRSIALGPNGNLWLMSVDRLELRTPTGTILKSIITNTNNLKYIVSDISGNCYLCTIDTGIIKSDIRPYTTVFKFDSNLKMIWASNNPNYPLKDPYYFIALKDNQIIVNGPEKIKSQHIYNPIKVTDVVHLIDQVSHA